MKGIEAPTRRSDARALPTIGFVTARCATSSPLVTSLSLTRAIGHRGRPSADAWALWPNGAVSRSTLVSHPEFVIHGACRQRTESCLIRLIH